MTSGHLINFAIVVVVVFLALLAYSFVGIPGTTSAA